MKTLKQIIILMSLAMLLVSCFKASVNREESPSLSLSRTESEFPPEIGKDTLTVASNRSWSIIKDSDVTWCSVTPMESINLSGSTTTSYIVVSYNRNLSRNARSTEVFIKGEGFSQKIRIVQKSAGEDSNISSFEELEQLDTLKWQ